MAPGTCLECGAGEVRCKGLCARCYFAGRYDEPRQAGLPGDVARRLERAWAEHRLTAALMAEPPRRGRSPWQAGAACRGRRDLRWAERRVTAAMRAVCDACPVRAECLAQALADPTIDGVWAATNPRERARMRQRPGPLAQGISSPRTAALPSPPGAG